MKTDYCKIAIGKDKPVRLILKDNCVVNVIDGPVEIKWLGMTKPEIEAIRVSNKWAAVWLLEEE